ncbi:MAG: hypothetical protein Q9174_001703 [Haloplaca sp. 1 TL-2023]
MADLTIEGDGQAAVTAAVLENGAPARPYLRFEDERTHLSASSTKPASLDGKSTTSGTTFAMDEKESLRPDDSASAKAAEEEDSCSGLGSGAPSSRVGSESGARAFRDQFHEISENIGCVPERPQHAGHSGPPRAEKDTAQRIASPLQHPLQNSATLVAPSALPSNGTFQIDYKEPDGKLLEALESPKDRLFVLRLEHEIIQFIQESTDATLDLRTPNSFCRLLAHKLADYYALTHHVDGAMNGVKLYRTPYCRVRTPLGAYTQTSPNPEVTASSQPAVKIMRRVDLVKQGPNVDSGQNTTASSIAPSKAGSEVGGDSGRATGLVSPTESNVSKDRFAMTREEREAKYKETRDRIFKGFEDVENADAAAHNDAQTGVSRTSSANGRRKSRKQQNIDDGFEARSHYHPYYPAMPYSGPAFDQTSASSAYFNPCMPQHYPTFGEQQSYGQTPMYPTSYGAGYQSMPNTPGYPSVPIQQYPAANNSGMNDYSNMQPMPGMVHQAPSSYYQQPQMTPGMGQASPAMSSPTIGNNVHQPMTQTERSDQSWSQMTYQYPYQQARVEQHFFSPQASMQNTPAAPNTVSYAYGQLPYQANLPGSRNVHPLPGSYNRQQAFNPQTRSFVPNSTPQPPYVNNGFQDGGSSNAYPSPTGSTPGLAHALPSTLSYQVPTAPQFGSFESSPEHKSPAVRKNNQNSGENQPPIKSSLAKWGTPATLPRKPPPPDPPSMDGRHSLPQNVPTHTNIQVASHGQPMPTFQNGVYFLPS